MFIVLTKYWIKAAFGSWECADWPIDFNGISTGLGLFCAKGLGNYAHCTFILTFFV